jgi:glycosyltransferase involved in cell wall biosynthesis
VDFAYERLASSRRDLWLFHAGVRLANLIVVQTSEQASQCKVRFGRGAIVIKSIAEPATPTASSPDFFLWIGRLVGYKQPQAFLDLAGAVPEARFAMVGLGSGSNPRLEELLKRKASGLPNLDLLPARPRAELLPLYDHAVAVVNTAQWEGMPNTFLEGWARGVPALALAHDPDGLIVSRGLGSFAAGSAQRLAASAREMWTSRHDRAELRRRCLAYVREEHDVERVIDGWIRALALRSEFAQANIHQSIDAPACARL